MIKRAGWLAATLLLWAPLGCGDPEYPTHDGGMDRITHPDAAPDLPSEARPDLPPDLPPPADHPIDHGPAPDQPADRVVPDSPSDMAHDTHPDAPPTDGPGQGQACDPNGTPCQPGLLCCQKCCLSPAQYTCVAPDPDGQCPAPDVFVDRDTLARDLTLGTQSFSADSCAIVEGCVNAPGTRRLLYFSTQTPNIGTTDLAFGVPDPNNGNFEFSACHNHYHFVHYARYKLIDAQGNPVGTAGRKQAFCLLDLAQYSSTAPSIPPGQEFTCDNQGIHMGWSDIYDAGLDCQWLDVTDVPDGDYQLEVEVNPERVFPEKDYSNNITRVPVHIGPAPPVDPLAACSGTGFDVGEQRDCGWQVALQGTCTAGKTVEVGCNGGTTCGAGTQLGSCTGDTVIRVCPGNTPCVSGMALASNDEACSNVDPNNHCSLTSFMCPATGQFTVLTGAYQPGDGFTCTVATQQLP